ncbi:cytochrome P450 [Schizopora paradoxa]|uniref:Cytochrome P450 n=1 Tax=Schizopora paradoxa TaxID=27342 RepID=A0A0H2RKJ8_9AGAM|nr:cytochrome P450 [Schizopora paradoxa]
MSSNTELLSYLIVSGTCFTLWSLYRGSRRHRLPPGPKPLPILGNIHDFPPPGELEGPHWAKHKALYGPISAVQAFGTTFIIVNDTQTAVKLLDKKSSIYSERPASVFGGEMCGFADVVSLQGTTEKWRNARKRIHNYLGTRTAVSRFNHLIELEARRLTLRLLDSPGTFFEQIQAFAGSTILKLTFGYSATSKGKDPLVIMGNKASNIFVNSVNNLWAVDVFPFLKYLPSWLPFMGFKTLAKENHDFVLMHLDLPVDFVKTEVNGTALASFIGHELENVSSPAEELEVKWLGAALYGAGADTTVTALESFVFGMALNPTIYRKVQMEVDSIVGHDRLPLLSDMPSLPYTEAVMKETLRFTTCHSRERYL